MPGGAPHTTKIGFSVVFATSIRSRVNGSLKMTTAPVIGTTTMSTLGSATIASRIWRPRASATGGPPQSTGLLTRRYAGMRPSCSTFCVSFGEGGERRPAAASMSAMCAPVPPEIA